MIIKLSKKGTDIRMEDDGACFWGCNTCFYSIKKSNMYFCTISYSKIKTDKLIIKNGNSGGCGISCERCHYLSIEGRTRLCSLPYIQEKNPVDVITDRIKLKILRKILK